MRQFVLFLFLMSQFVVSSVMALENNPSTKESIIEPVDESIKDSLAQKPQSSIDDNTEHNSKINSSISFDSYVNQLITKANSNKLYAHHSWRRLLYLPESTSSTEQNQTKNKSKITQKSFFNAPDGHKNPQNELIATLKGIFTPVSKENMSVVCRFPARTAWLVEQLEIDTSHIPDAKCPAFKKWFAGINPYKTTMIFASDYMNNPSSMFGHTLLRIDQGEKTEDLLAYAVSYAAQSAQGTGIAFAIKGLTGGYNGEFTILPYYEKVKDYGDIESRDIWEYELDLTPAQTKQLVRHVWEMRSIHFPYYFISDNCAYALMALIDIANPKLNTKELFPLDAAPAQTIRTLAQKTDLIKKTSFRPALMTQLNAQASKHGHQLAKTAHKVALKGDYEALNGLTEIEQAKVLEMAYDDLYLSHIKRTKEEPEKKKRLRELLVKRSGNKAPKQRPDIIKPSASPDTGHDSKRISVGLGHRQYAVDNKYNNQLTENKLFFGIKGAYHELMDNPIGYRQGMSINALDFLFSLSTMHDKSLDNSIKSDTDAKFKLEHFNFIAVDSYTPISTFNTPYSWGMSGGLTQLDLVPQANQLVGFLNYHGGFVISAGQLDLNASTLTKNSHNKPDQSNKVNIDTLNSFCYAQVLLRAQAGQTLDNGWRVATGPYLGCLKYLTPKTRMQIKTEMPYWYSNNYDKSTKKAQYHFKPKIDLALQYDLSKNQAIKTQLNYQKVNNDMSSLGLNIHFLQHF